MGASREGTMSVRDRINLILNESSSEDNNPPDKESETHILPTIATPIKTSSAPAPLTTPLSFITPSLYVKGDVTCRTGTGPSVLCNYNTSNSIKDVNSETEANAQIQEVRVAPDSTNNNSSSGDGNETQGYNSKVNVILHNLIYHQLHLVKRVSERLRISNSKRETLEKEKIQLQQNLESVREDHTALLEKYVTSEEQRSQFEARIQGQQETIMGQHETIKSHQATIKEHQETVRKQQEKIQDLERRLAVALSRKAMVNQETCTTPLASPSTSTQIDYTPSSAGHEEEEDGPIRKRMKMTISTRPSSSFSGSKHLKESIPSTSSLPSISQKSRSESPPHLSPALTPKSSSYKKFSNFASSSKVLQTYYPEMDDDLDICPVDEFRDELEQINNLSRASSSENENKVSHKSSTPFRNHSIKIHSSQFRQPPTSSSPSAFIRPFPFPGSRSARLYSSTDSRRRLTPNLFENKNSLPVSSSCSLFSPSSSSSTSKKNSSGSVVTHRNTYRSTPPRDLPQLISLRSNNFLDLNRPVPRRPPVMLEPFASEEEIRHFRSLDLSASAMPSAGSEMMENFDLGLGMSQQSPPQNHSTFTQKKRPPGRPPGSLSRFKKSRFPVSHSSSSSSASGGRVSSTGINGTTEAPTPPPQRFSQRGRLLKPNRARYSPDLDVCVTLNSSLKDKSMTTRKNYLTPDLLVPEVFHDDWDTNYGDDASQDMDNRLPMRPEIGDGEELEVVEVPKWRLSILEGFEEGEDRFPLLDDDMSDEAFLKRHQKLEAKEKQRKRWDSQRIREESYLDRLKRKQEERERLKEFRRQQRKRKGRMGNFEEESVLPVVEDIKAIYVSDELPVGAFGRSLPVVEKVEFSLGWIPKQKQKSEIKSSLIMSPTPTLREQKTLISKTKVKLTSLCHDDIDNDSRMQPSSSSSLKNNLATNSYQSNMEIDENRLKDSKRKSDSSQGVILCNLGNPDLQKRIQSSYNPSLTDSTVSSSSPNFESPYTMVHLVEIEEENSCDTVSSSSDSCKDGGDEGPISTTDFNPKVLENNPASPTSSSSSSTVTVPNTAVLISRENLDKPEKDGSTSAVMIEPTCSSSTLIESPTKITRSKAHKDSESSMNSLTSQTCITKVTSSTPLPYTLATELCKNRNVRR